jgi:hypothetical protein
MTDSDGNVNSASFAALLPTAQHFQEWCIFIYTECRVYRIDTFTYAM